MGLFDLPRGRVELLLKPKQAGARYDGWTNVMMTDGLCDDDLAALVEDWQGWGYNVLGARFNGRNVNIPKDYHWELSVKDGERRHFNTRKEAVELRKADRSVKGFPILVFDR